MNPDQAERALAKMTKRMRVAVASTCVERIRVLYRHGNVHVRVRDVATEGLGIDADADLLDAGLELAWAFAERGEINAGACEAIIPWLKERYVYKPTSKRSPASEGALAGVHFALAATEDETIFSTTQAISLTEASLGVALYQLGLGGKDEDDEDVAGDLGDLEERWQLKVVARAARKDAEPTRENFAELLAMQPRWLKFLDLYKAKYGTASNEGAESRGNG